MTNQEMKLLHERMKKEDPKLLVLMEKCFDAGVLSGKELAQRTWVGLTDEEIKELYGDDDNFRMTKKYVIAFARALEAKLRRKNEDRN